MADSTKQAMLTQVQAILSRKFGNLASEPGDDEPMMVGLPGRDYSVLVTLAGDDAARA